MTFEKLLAKSWNKAKGEPWRKAMRLPVHLNDAHRAAVQLLDATADDQLAALGLERAKYCDRLGRLVRVAAVIHDLGKANDHFQGMVHYLKERYGRPQGLRHEWVTLWILERTAVGDWLRPAIGDDPADWQIVCWAVAGHHPAYNRPSPPRLAMDGAGDTLHLLLDHPDFAECLQVVANALGLAGPPRFDPLDPLHLVGPKNVFASWIAGWYRSAAVEWERMQADSRYVRLTAAVKNGLIAADVAGSALPRAVADETARSVWIAQALGNTPKPDQISRLVQRRLKGGKPFEFQDAVASSTSDVTFVRAGCGSGKTLAAYLWAAERHPNKRLYFCYPTTGTATEGFREYLFVPERDRSDDDLNTELFHGRAEVDLDQILAAVGDDDRSDADAVARIESLDSWSTPVVACTVDTVLGIVQNNRRGLYAWPALAGAAFVFDEIHAYDDRLFGALLRFLGALPGVPALLMTASLPAARLAALEACVRRRGGDLPTVPIEPLASEKWVRYQRQGPVDDRDPLPEIRAEWERGGKVLWVRNTVNRVIDAADRAIAAGMIPKIYHSRFRYEDRAKRHAEVVDAFDENMPGPVLACVSQVAEMSLDLKGVTLLVTELAPVPALIQRLGRLNRQASEKTGPQPFIVLEPDDHLPYTPADLDSAREWLKGLAEGPLSQQALAQAWAETDKSTRPDFVASAWLDGGPMTTVLELREASPGITIVLERDKRALERYAERIRQMKNEAARRGQEPSRKELKPQNGERRLSQVVLPMPPPPRGVNWRDWDKFQNVPVAPEGSIEYDPERGALRWQQPSEKDQPKRQRPSRATA
jgi:CRISPR-associated endonuclease/helicase Cas3